MMEPILESEAWYDRRFNAVIEGETLENVTFGGPFKPLEDDIPYKWAYVVETLDGETVNLVFVNKDCYLVDFDKKPILAMPLD